MEFNREAYILHGLLVPLFGLVIALSVLLWSVPGLFQGPLTIHSGSLWMALFSVAFIAGLLYSNISGAWKYTWHLFREGEADTTVIRDELQEIILVKHSPRYPPLPSSDTGMRTRAVLLHMGGRELYCMSGEGLTVGKKLQVRYLPRSRIVLSWRAISEDGSPFAF